MIEPKSIIAHVLSSNRPMSTETADQRARTACEWCGLPYYADTNDACPYCGRASHEAASVEERQVRADAADVTAAGSSETDRSLLNRALNRLRTGLRAG